MGRLAEIAALPNATVQVLPAVAHPANASGFMVTDDAALCEHVKGSFVYTDEHSVTSWRGCSILFGESATACQSHWHC